MSELGRLKRWVRKNSPRRGILCHFYVTETDRQYYGRAEFAYFNLSSRSREWLVRGTEGHGIRSKRDRSSNVPCLNCFQVDDDFLDAFRELEIEDNKFQMGILMNKRKLRNVDAIENVVDVQAGIPAEWPPLCECHEYDNPRFRRGVLSPFHWCSVVRLVVPKRSLLDRPIASIPADAIMALLVKSQDRDSVKKALEVKGMQWVEVFSVL